MPRSIADQLRDLQEPVETPAPQSIADQLREMQEETEGVAGPIGPPGGYATEEEVTRRRAMGEARLERTRRAQEVIRGGREALTNIATFPGRLAAEVQERGVGGTLRGAARGYGEEMLELGRLVGHGTAFARSALEQGRPAERAQAILESRRARVEDRAAMLRERMERGIEPYTGSPTQMIGRGAGMAAEAAAITPILARGTAQIPVVRRPFQLSAEQWQRSPGVAITEEMAGGIGAEEALKDVQPETGLGTVATGLAGGSAYVGTLGLLRGSGRVAARASARAFPLPFYRDLLPSHLREKPYRIATNELRYAIQGKAPPEQRRELMGNVIRRIEAAEATAAGGPIPTLGALGGRAGLTESERLVLRREPYLHGLLQERRRAIATGVVEQYTGLVPEPHLQRLRETAQERVESTLADVEAVVGATRRGRGGAPLDTTDLASSLTANGGVVSDVSPRTSQVFIRASSPLGLQMAAAMKEGQTSIRRGGHIFEFEVSPATPDRFMVRGRAAPSTPIDENIASSTMGRALQEAHDNIFSDIYSGYDDIARRAGGHAFYAPKIASAVRSADLRGTAAQPQFLPAEVRQLIAERADPENPTRNSYTIRELIAMERRLEPLLFNENNDQRRQALGLVYESINESIHDLATSQRPELADYLPIFRELQQVNAYRDIAVDTWRHGLASLAQGRDPSEAIKSVIVRDGTPGSAEALVRLGNAARQRPDMVPMIEDAILEQAFYEASVPIANGTKRTFDAARLDRFKQKYGGTLALFPDAAAKLADVREAQRAVDALGLPSSMTGQRAALGTLSSFVDDPGREIDRILDRSPTDRMREVGKWMSRFQGDQDAIQALRYSMWDRLMQRTIRSDVTMVHGPYNYLNPQRVLETVAENRAMLTQLYGADHVKRMEQLAELSTVAQRMAADQHVTLEQEQALADAAGSWFHTVIAQIYGTTIKIARAARTGYRLHSAIDNKQARELLAEFYSNPTAAKVALRKLTMENEPAMLRMLATATNIPWVRDLALTDERKEREERRRAQPGR